MREVIATTFRVLFFRASTEELRAMDNRHLGFGLVVTWLVGIGRWWEDPRANLVQHLGVGSVVYIFVLSLFLWLLLWPLAREYWSYRNILTFISLTSIPGVLYAIPVRHGMKLETAAMVRLWFLAVVAGWRVALLGFYLRRGARFFWSQTIVATLFPLTLIVVALTALNLEKVVFDIMGGARPEDQSVNDGAYAVLFLITILSVYFIAPAFGLGYLVMSIGNFVSKRRQRKLKAEETQPQNETPTS
jgi:hypothetical protein